MCIITWNYGINNVLPNNYITETEINRVETYVYCVNENALYKRERDTYVHLTIIEYEHYSNIIYIFLLILRFQDDICNIIILII